MKAIATAAQMRECDRVTIEEFGLPGLVLMESASRAVANAAMELLEETGGRQVTILCGKGNNGGDGIAVGRHLLNNDYEPSVFLIGKQSELKGDAASQARFFEQCGGELIELAEDDELEFDDSNLIIDALLGTGFKGEVTGLMWNVIETVNDSGIPVISIDIPSGISTDSGDVSGAAIEADLTVTFGMLKPGLIFSPGREHAGKVIVADIGIPASVVEEQGIELYQVEPTDLPPYLPKLAPDAHKGTAGRVYILGGSPGLTGAACLTAEAAAHSGAGLVVVGTPAGCNSILEAKLTEPMTQPLPETTSGCLAVSGWEAIRAKIEWADAVAIGPGLGRDPETAELIHQVIAECGQKKPLMIDADGLYHLGNNKAWLKELGWNIALTPHPGELAHLLGVSTEEVIHDRIGIARKCAAEWQVVVHLKGAPSLTALPDGGCLINSTGNPGIATGGSGDVLTGIITALAGGGLEVAEAAWVGACLHGLSGDEAAEDIGERSLVASDLIRYLPDALAGLE